jgi:hypothetical protein
LDRVGCFRNGPSKSVQTWRSKQHIQVECSKAGIPILDIEPESSRKRTATSPLGSEFDKKSRLGLTDEELNHLNENLRDWVLDHSAVSNPEDISTRVLAQTLQHIALNLLATSCASTIDQSWKKVNYREERINLLSREDRVRLASIWVEARGKGDWKRFASQCASIPSHLFLHE